MSFLFSDLLNLENLVVFVVFSITSSLFETGILFLDKNPEFVPCFKLDDSITSDDDAPSFLKDLLNLLWYVVSFTVYSFEVSEALLLLLSLVLFCPLDVFESLSVTTDCLNILLALISKLVN